MFGILLLSHGDLAEAMLSTAKMIYRAADEGVATIGLRQDEKAEDFDQRLKRAIESVDQGEGVVVLADLLGGTPSNRLAAIANDDIKIITGMNLGMVLELVFSRKADNLDINNLIDTSKKSIVYYNAHLDNIELNEIL